MDPREAHARPVTETTPEEILVNHQPSFNKQEFDDAIFHKGYQIYLEKCLKCPCRIAANQQPLPGCYNCGGTGWVFINKKSTRAVIQSMNRQTKFQNWTAEDRGTVSVSLRDDDKIAWMDRVTILDLMGTHSEVLKLKKFGDRNVWTGKAIYYPLSIEHIFLFAGSEKPFAKLTTQEYEIQDSYVRVLRDLSGVQEPTISIRYQHNPQYHIIDITREQMAQRGTLPADCDPNDPVQNRLGWMPVHGVARRAHYIMDIPDRFGESLFDNTDIASAVQLRECSYYQDFRPAGAEAQTGYTVGTFKVNGVNQLTDMMPFPEPLNVITVNGNGFVTNMLDALNACNVPNFTFFPKPDSLPDGESGGFFTVRYPKGSTWEIIILNNGSLSRAYRYTNSAARQWNGTAWVPIQAPYGSAHGTAIDCHDV